MKPQSFSASALHVAGLCLSRYSSQYLGKMPEGGPKRAASMGSAVHGCLEQFVNFTQVEQDEDWNDKDLLRACYDVSYQEAFGSVDYETEEYSTGWQLVLRWHKRTDFKGLEVLSLETKENFPLHTSIGDIPFNYIFDRLDRITDREDEYQVVDYKTSKWNINQSELRKKIQARSYAVACRIKYPNAKRIWVEFDMLRHDTVAVSFTRDDDVKFYQFLEREAERIINSPVPTKEEPLETLNEECRWCPRKARCLALRKNIGSGGIHSITPSKAAVMRGEVAAQLSGLKDLVGELDKILLAEAAAEDSLELTYPDAVVNVYTKKQRTPNNAAIISIVGQKIAERYGKMNLGDIDDLLKGNEISDAQKAEVRAQISTDYTNPSVKISKPDPLEEQPNE